MIRNLTGGLSFSRHSKPAGKCEGDLKVENVLIKKEEFQARTNNRVALRDAIGAKFEGFEEIRVVESKRILVEIEFDWKTMTSIFIDPIGAARDWLWSDAIGAGAKSSLVAYNSDVEIRVIKEEEVMCDYGITKFKYIYTEMHLINAPEGSGVSEVVDSVWKE